MEKQDTSDPVPTSTALVQYVSPIPSIANDDEKRSFQFWHEEAAPIFSYYFGISSRHLSLLPYPAYFSFSGHSFWADLLPKIGVFQPAVKHLLLATSSLVETAALQGVPLDKNAVYQAHYTKAIQATCASPQVEGVLMACLLFACCEFMQGSVGNGLRHIHAGLNIIDEWFKSTGDSEATPSQTAKMIVNTIGPIFLAYVDKAPTYGMGDVTISECACTTMIRPTSELPYVGPFNAIHRAHHAMDGIGHHVARMMDFRRPAWSPSPPDKMQALLENWRLSFDTFEANMMQSTKQRFTLGLQLLRVHYTMLSIMLRAASSKKETVYERFREQFKWIVDQYDIFSKAWAKDESSKYFTGVGNLDYHMGYIPPLFFTATRCRDPATRMSALSHLSSLGVVENNWTSCTAYLIARKIIKIENTRSISNKRTGVKEEQDLIRPVEVFITDKRMTQAGLEFVAFPYDSTPVLQETIDLQFCSASASAHWVSVENLNPPDFWLPPELTHYSP